MGDLVDLFSTAFDTAVPAAGDASMFADAAGAADAGSTVADAASAASSAPVDESAGLDMTPPATPDAAPAPEPAPTENAASAATDPGAPGAKPYVPPEQNYPGNAPVSSGNGNGMIGNAAQWAKDSPAAAKVFGEMLKGGASGAMTALAMRNKIQAEREKEERARQDVIRRGEIQALPAGTFTPKPGIIAGARG